MNCVVENARIRGFSEKRIHQIELALEEALVNVFRYAYPESCGEVEVVCREKGGRLVIDIIDSGVPFDPGDVPDPDTKNCSIREKKLGGLGCFLIRKMADEVRYRREAGHNVLTLVLGRSCHDPQISN